MFLTYVVEKLGGVLQASLTVFNVVGGPMLGLYTLGMLCSRVNTKVSIASILLLQSIFIGFILVVGTKKQKQGRQIREK